MGWAGRANGELLDLAAEGGFDGLVTVDRRFEYQQNESTLPIAVIVLVAPRNRFQDLERHVPAVMAIVADYPEPRFYRVTA